MTLSLSPFPIAFTRDPDEAQSILSRELSNLRLESVSNRRAFQFEMNGAHLGNALIGFNRFATETRVNTGVIEDAVVVSFSVGPPSTLKVDRESVSPSQGAVASPSSRVTIHRSPGSGYLLIRSSRETLEERIRELTDLAPKETIAFDRCVTLDLGPGAQIRRLLSSIIRDLESDPTILSNRLLRIGLDEMVVNAMLALPNNYSASMQSDRQADVGNRLVRQAEELLEAGSTDAITISDVVAECGCSRSSLFSSFRRYRGYTPMQFLSECRLRDARNALSHSTAADSVASIARACGFLHLGRFSSMYRKRFGEAPSETMRKA